MFSRWTLTVGLVIGWVLGHTPRCDADLAQYVNKPDPAYRWAHASTVTNSDWSIFTLELTSQVWQGIPWTHQIQVYLPRGVQPGGLMMLWNTGGSPSLGNMLFGLEIARKIKLPCAFLYNIPNQPLLGNKREDALIAETFVRYLQTGDGDWPLLFPMVKSVVKGMDALQAFSREEWKQPLTGFILSGASKRGWTTWLTAAVDTRLVGIAPVVIDTLNMPIQMEHQKRCFGQYSRMIKDYTEAGLVPVPDTERARRLWQMVDPYLYREKYTMPKLILNGNNDPYWTVDALNLYWDGLPAKKCVVYVPNAGHDLRQKDQPAEQERLRSLNALAAFTRHLVLKKPMPEMTWKHEDVEGRARLTVTTSLQPRGARHWIAESTSRDFRNSKWAEQPVQVNGKTVAGSVSRDDNNYKAFYAELDYEIDGIPYQLSTQIRVLEPRSRGGE